MAMTDYDPTKGQPLANLGRVIAEPPTPPSLFREACERLLDMLRADDGQAWSEAERFLKRHAPDLYNEIGMPDPKREYRPNEGPRKREEDREAHNLRVHGLREEDLP